MNKKRKECFEITEKEALSKIFPWDLCRVILWDYEKKNKKEKKGPTNKSELESWGRMKRERVKRDRVLSIGISG